MEPIHSEPENESTFVERLMDLALDGDDIGRRWRPLI
jgi:hypothetical protein